METRGNTAGWLIARVEAPVSAPTILSTEWQEATLWVVARRVTRSKGFAKSKFLTNFLLHICEMHLTGRDAELTEQKIGERVFERPEGYRPGDDNIVRNYARLLRQRLDGYFDGEGQQEPLRIVVPRGAYIPLAVEPGGLIAEPQEGTLQLAAAGHPAETAAGTAEEVLFPAFAEPPMSTPQTFSPDTPRGWRIPFLWIALALSVALSAVLAVALLQARSTVHGFAPATSPLWSAFFSPSRATIVIPADTGLVIYQDLTRQRVHLSEYAGGEYQKAAASPGSLATDTINDLGRRRYTSFVDLQWIARLSQRPEVSKDRFQVRYAREVNLDELKDSNAILFGSFDANPWAELFQRDLNFRFEHESAQSNDVIIRNLHPSNTEAAVYRTNRSDPAHTTFAMLVVRPSLDGKGRVLLVEGINMAGPRQPLSISSAKRCWRCSRNCWIRRAASSLSRYCSRPATLVPTPLRRDASRCASSEMKWKQACPTAGQATAPPFVIL